MYATKDDLVLRYSAAEVAQLERGLTPEQSIGTSIQDATEIVNGYISAQYTVPLLHPPANIKIYVCDIARYLLYKSRATEEVRQRYEDAISFLKLVAAGKAKLQVINEETQEVEEPKKSPATMPIGTRYSGGVFADSVLDLMPSIK